MTFLSLLVSVAVIQFFTIRKLKYQVYELSSKIDLRDRQLENCVKDKILLEQTLRQIDYNANNIRVSFEQQRKLLDSCQKENEQLKKRNKYLDRQIKSLIYSIRKIYTVTASRGYEKK